MSAPTQTAEASSSKAGDPKTPMKQAAQNVNNINSTPYSQGTASQNASRSEYPDPLGGREINPMIYEDIKDTPVVSIKAFIAYMLLHLKTPSLGGLNTKSAQGSPVISDEHLHSDLAALLEKVREVANGGTGTVGEKIRANLQQIVAAKTETAMYKPFIKATNQALSALKDVKLDAKSDPECNDLMFHLNDRPTAGGREATKPDILALPRDVWSRLYPKISWEDIALGPSDSLSHSTPPSCQKPPSNIPHQEYNLAIEVKRTSSSTSASKTTKEDGPPKALKPVPTSYKATELLAETAPLSLPTPTTSEGPAPKITSQMSSAAESANSANISYSADKTSTGGKRKHDQTESGGGEPDAKRRASEKVSVAKRPSEKTLAEHAVVRAGRYAADRMSSAPWVCNALVPVVKDDKLYLFYFDRQGGIRSTGFNYIQDLPYYLVFLWILQRFSPEQGGVAADLRPPFVDVDDDVNVPEAKGKKGDTEQRIPELFEREECLTCVISGGLVENPLPAHAQPAPEHDTQGGSGSVDISESVGHAVEEPASQSSFTHPTTSSQSPPTPGQGDTSTVNPPGDPLKIDVKNSLTRSFVLRGRATQVYPAAERSGIPQQLDPELAVKFSWPESSRRNEAEVIEEAVKAGKDNEYIKDHLPSLRSWRDYDYFNTSHIRKELARIQKAFEIDVSKVRGLRRGDKFELDTKGARSFRVMVFDGLVPITTIPPKDMYRCLWECFFCHFYLWRAGIHHGDISLANLMARKFNGVYYGVLNDYDLAIVEHPDTHRDAGMDRTGMSLLNICSWGSYSTQMKGTQPFMALDLLRDIIQQRNNPRIYRYDAESFTWVLIWLCMRYPLGGKTLRVPPLQRWLDSDFEVCCALKNDFLTENHTPTKHYQDYWRAATVLHMWWTRFWFDKKTFHFDHEDSTPYPEPTMEDIANRLVQFLHEKTKRTPHLHVTLPKREPFLKSVTPTAVDTQK